MFSFNYFPVFERIFSKRIDGVRYRQHVRQAKSGKLSFQIFFLKTDDDVIEYYTVTSDGGKFMDHLGDFHFLSFFLSSHFVSEQFRGKRELLFIPVLAKSLNMSG
jgi:hypothetical protein